MWQTCLLPDAFARAFAPIPPEPIWQWAEKEVWLDSKEAAEAGNYRSAKTPWTRRLQDLVRDPRMFVVDYTDPAKPVWTVERCREVDVKKSSQSGFSEACLNGIRWKAKYRPQNVIYSIDTREEAKNISARLLPSLQKIDADIFTGDDDDIGTLTMRLRAMDIWFFGSFSSGKFANKQAPLVIADELEEHGQAKGDAATHVNLESRKKTASNGLQINLSKPKRRNGPIARLFETGNQEEFHIRCPHCDKLQWLTFWPEEKKIPFAETLSLVEIDGLSAWLPDPLPLGQVRTVKTGHVAFDHCKNHLGEWDELRILRDAHHVCGYCGERISEEDKPRLVADALWLPTAVGSPGIVSQHISDLYSADAESSTGQIVLHFLRAKKNGRVGLQGFLNHRLGLELHEEANRTRDTDIKAAIAGQTEGDKVQPYRKGTLPFDPAILILGSDVGASYAKWSLIASDTDYEDIAVIDWGEELDPESIAELMNKSTWVFGEKKYRITLGFIDAKYRRPEVNRACLNVPGMALVKMNRLTPVAGLGGTAARSIRQWSHHRVPSYPKNFRQLTFNDREAKNDLYISTIKKRKTRIYFPTDTGLPVHAQFVAELCAERLEEDENGVLTWNPHPGANHWGDCVKVAHQGLRFLTRGAEYAGPEAPEDTPAE
jgi:hypothetical protein